MNLLKKFQRYQTIMNEKEKVYQLLDNFEFNEFNKNILNAPNGISRVVMILPDIYPNLGGITSALRILTSLQVRGCQITIATIGDMDIHVAERNVLICMPNFKGKVRKASECIGENYDVCIATNWMTAYWAQKLDGYKVYFVQDYEPDFFEGNDFSYLARETYNFGYHIISLGKWNVEKIKRNVKNVNGKIDYIDFPYSKSEYVYKERNYLAYKKKKTINIACYIRYIGRRIPYICEYLLEKVKKELNEKEYCVNIFFFGIDKHNKFNCGKNIGKLSREELADLYQKCDFGMVASMSNISLVPFEMLASGLPVIEFSAGSYSYFLGEDTALLIDFNYKSLSNGILDLINNPEKLENMHKCAEKKLESLSWDNTCDEFWNILTNITE